MKKINVVKADVAAVLVLMFIAAKLAAAADDRRRQHEMLEAGGAAAGGSKSGAAKSCSNCIVFALSFTVVEAEVGTAGTGSMKYYDKESVV